MQQERIVNHSHPTGYLTARQLTSRACFDGPMQVFCSVCRGGGCVARNEIRKARIKYICRNNGLLKNFGFSEGGVASGAFGIRTIAMLGPSPRIGQHHGVVQVSSKLCELQEALSSVTKPGFSRLPAMNLHHPPMNLHAVYEHSRNRSLARVFGAFIVSRPSQQTVRSSENTAVYWKCHVSVTAFSVTQPATDDGQCMSRWLHTP